MRFPVRREPDMGSISSFDVRTESQDGVAHVAVIGELDMATAPALGDALVGVQRSGVREVTLDVGAVTFIDSTGLRVILQAWKRAQTNGHSIVVVRASRYVWRLFELCGFTFILDGSPADVDVATTGAHGD